MSEFIKHEVSDRYLVIGNDGDWKIMDRKKVALSKKSFKKLEQALARVDQWIKQDEAAA